MLVLSPCGGSLLAPHILAKPDPGYTLLTLHACPYALSTMFIINTCLLRWKADALFTALALEPCPALGTEEALGADWLGVTGYMGLDGHTAEELAGCKLTLTPWTHIRQKVVSHHQRLGLQCLQGFLTLLI